MNQLRREDRVIDGPREGKYLPGLEPTTVPSGSNGPAGCSWNLPTLRAASKVGDGQPRGFSQIKEEMLETQGRNIQPPHFDIRICNSIDVFSDNFLKANT